MRITINVLAFASDFVPDRLRASAIGWYSATAGLFQLIASLIAGMLWDIVGHTSIFLYGAASAFRDHRVGAVASPEPTRGDLRRVPKFATRVTAPVAS